MTWPQDARDLMDAMIASGVKVERQVIAPGPNRGIRCSQFTVHPQTVGSQPLVFSGMPNRPCAAVPTPILMATYTKDCAPLPGNDGAQPDAAKTTAWTLAYLGDCQAIWNAIYDAYHDRCSGVLIGVAQFTGPTGGVASMSIPVSIGPET